MLIARELVEKNPFAKIEKIAQDIGKNHVFTGLEKKKLIELLKENVKKWLVWIIF